jgi:hypothetical protein
MRTNTALLLLALMAVSIKADFELVEKSFLGNDFADLDGTFHKIDDRMDCRKSLQ